MVTDAGTNMLKVAFPCVEGRRKWSLVGKVWLIFDLVHKGEISRRAFCRLGVHNFSISLVKCHCVIHLPSLLCFHSLFSRNAPNL